MNQDQLNALFDQQAAGYDAQWAKTQAVRVCLHLLLEAGFAELPAQASILCVGVGRSCPRTWCKKPPLASAF